MVEGDYLEFRHINALMRYHLHLDPMALLGEGDEGELSFDEYARVWGELEWVLERQMTASAGSQSGSE